MNARSDIHRPVNLVTENYEFIGVCDTRPPMPGPMSGAAAFEAYAIAMDRIRFLGGLVRTSPLAERGLTQCHHCGAHLRYAAVLRHENGDHIAVGETCLDNRFSMATAEFQRLRKANALDAERRRMTAAAADVFEGLPETAQKALGMDSDCEALACGDAWVAGVLNDIRTQIWTWGRLSEKQIAFVIRLVEEAPAKKAERDAQQAEVKVPVRTGRIEFEGVIVKRTVKIGEWGEVTKVTVKVTEDDGVWLVYLTLPAAICNAERWDIVRMTATVKSSGDTPHFGFGSRPSKAKIVGRQALNEQIEDSLA